MLLLLCVYVIQRDDELSSLHVCLRSQLSLLYFATLNLSKLRATSYVLIHRPTGNGGDGNIGLEMVEEEEINLNQ